MQRYLVERPLDTVEVVILPSKSDGKYSFVNLTEGHICRCKFDTVAEALEDMDRLILLGRVIKYRRIYLPICP